MKLHGPSPTADAGPAHALLDPLPAHAPPGPLAGHAPPGLPPAHENPGAAPAADIEMADALDMPPGKCMLYLRFNISYTAFRAFKAYVLRVAVFKSVQIGRMMLHKEGITRG
jgi:hypothetical protein